MPIDCRGCKAYCCRHVGRFMKDLDRGDGICLYLSNDNRCQIYDHRPIWCNTDLAYEKYFKDKYTREEYDEINRQACEVLHEKFEETETRETEEDRSEVEDEVPKKPGMEETQKYGEGRTEVRPNNGQAPVEHV